MAPPGTPPEAQSAPADSQVWEALKGESAQSAPLAKLTRAEQVQQEEARLKAELGQLRTHVRQARAQTLDFGERARHARGKLAQEKEKLGELGEKVLRCRTSVAAWPGGDRGMVDDPEVAALATTVMMEQEWLVHARTTLREVVEKRDLELRRLGPAALLDGADVEQTRVTARSYSRRLAKPTKQLGKQEMARVSEALYRGLDGEWCRHVAPEPGSDKIIRPDAVERARRVALEDVGRFVRQQAQRQKQKEKDGQYPHLGVPRACRLETVETAASLAASRRAHALGHSAAVQPASKRPARKELVLRPVHTEPMPLDAFIAKLYTVPVKRREDAKKTLGQSLASGESGLVKTGCTPLPPAQALHLVDRLYGGAVTSREKVERVAKEHKEKEIADVRRVRKYGNRPASAPPPKGLSTPAAVEAAVEAAPVEERLSFYFVCPGNLEADRKLEVRLPDGREFTLRVPDEYNAGEEFAAVFPPIKPEVPISAAEAAAARSKKVQTMADHRAATKQRKALEVSLDPEIVAAASIQTKLRLRNAQRVRAKRAEAAVDAQERRRKAGLLILRFIRRRRFAKVSGQISTAMKQRSAALGRVVKNKEVPRVPLGLEGVTEAWLTKVLQEARLLPTKQRGDEVTAEVTQVTISLLEGREVTDAAEGTQLRRLRLIFSRSGVKVPGTNDLAPHYMLLKLSLLPRLPREPLLQQFSSEGSSLEQARVEVRRKQESTELLAPQKTQLLALQKGNDEARRALTARCGARAERRLRNEHIFYSPSLLSAGSLHADARRAGVRLPTVYYSAFEGVDEDAIDDQFVSADRLTLAADGSSMRAVLLLQDLTGAGGVLLEEAAPGAKKPPASPNKAPPLQRSSSSSRSAVGGGGASAHVNEFIEFEPLTEVIAAAEAAARAKAEIEARQAAEGRGAATVNHGRLEPVFGNNALGASVSASLTDGLGRLVIVAPPPPLPTAKARACARALGRLHGALWDLSPPSAHGVERERPPSAADLTPPPLYASFLFDEPDGEATRQTFAQKSTPGAPSLLQTFVQRYATHASFAPLLQARATQRALQALHHALPSWASELQELGARSDCALHGEFCSSNLLARKGSVEEVCVLDFEQLGGGPAAWDLGFFLTSSCAPEAAAGAARLPPFSEDAALLHAYHRELHATLDARAKGGGGGGGGQAGPSKETLGREVRMALLGALVLRIAARATSLSPKVHDATLRAGGSAAEALRRLTQWEIALLTRCVQMHTEAHGQQPPASAAAPPLFAAIDTEDDEAFELEMQAALDPAAPESTAPKAVLPASYFRASRRAPAAAAARSPAR